MALFIEIFLIGIGLSMDAFAVSICKGLALKECKLKKAMVCGVWFGGFQALMPLVGYFLGSFFADVITKYSHWIAFALLAFLGAKMIKESFESEELDDNMGWKTMLVLAVATSIDASAVGVTFAFLDVNILFAVIVIGVTTFAFSAAGVKIGSVFGEKYKSKAEIAGGIILILIGLKILLDGLGII